MAAASQVPGLSEEQLAAVLVTNSKWPYAASDDQWMRSHDALRADLDDIASALATLQKQTAPLTQWQVRTRAGTPSARPR
jgi:hypothetical protein